MAGGFINLYQLMVVDQRQNMDGDES